MTRQDGFGSDRAQHDFRVLAFPQYLKSTTVPSLRQKLLNGNRCGNDCLSGTGCAEIEFVPQVMRMLRHFTRVLKELPDVLVTLTTGLARLERIPVGGQRSNFSAGLRHQFDRALILFRQGRHL